MTDRLGQQLGNYRLVRLLGRGGFAEVYIGEHLRLNTQAAIKVLHTSLEGDDIRGFLREAQTVAHLRHPHIVRVFDFDVENHTPFLVMDYLSNGNVRHAYPKGTPLPLQTIISYIGQVASALQYAHDEKLIHRDVKPENMLLDRDNTLVLSDFGIALMSQSSRYQNTQEVAGTAAYMAPEQLQGHPRRASDQYALGMVVYEWLTGDHPFHGSFSEIASQHLFVPPPPLREKVPAIPPDVEQVVLTALAKDPEERFASVQAFANALTQASRTRPPELFQQTPADTPMTAGSFQPASLPNQTNPLTSSFQQSQPQQHVVATPPGLPKRGASGLSPISRRPVQAPLLRRTAFLVAIVFLLVISSFVIFHVVSSNTANSLAIATVQARSTISAQGNATATAQAVATVQAQATATAQAAATATAQAQATATAMQQIYAQATGGPPAITDPLSDDRNSWGLFTTSWGGECAFTGGAYHLTLSKPGFVIFCTGRDLGNLNNFALQVQVSMVQGNEGGIVFGQTANGAYRIDISSAGTYILYQHTKTNVLILQNSASPAIRTGLNQTNVLTVIVKNSNFYFYVNSQFVTSAHLSAYGLSGGDLAAQSNNEATDAAFSNLKIWLL